MPIDARFAFDRLLTQHCSSVLAVPDLQTAPPPERKGLVCYGVLPRFHRTEAREEPQGAQRCYRPQTRPAQHHAPAAPPELSRAAVPAPTPGRHGTAADPEPPPPAARLPRSGFIFSAAPALGDELGRSARRPGEVSGLRTPTGGRGCRGGAASSRCPRLAWLRAGHSLPAPPPPRRAVLP